MIDSKGRQYFNGIFAKLAKKLLEKGLTPNQLTLLALFVGLLSGLSLLFKWSFLSFLLLWLSGLFDVLDGEMARQSGKASLWGAQLDVICDRLVELGIFWALAINHPQARMPLLVLVSCILISMTVFLTTAMYTEKIKTEFTKRIHKEARVKGKQKSFYYQAGLMERTEGFIASSFMILFPRRLLFFTWLYAALILITIVQRLMEAKRIFSLVNKNAS